MSEKLAKGFVDVIVKAKLFYYRNVLRSPRDKDSMLSADEAYCMDAISVLGRPTIGEFASFVQISPQSAAYKVNNLVRKGFITRTRGDDDKREFFLETTDKYKAFHGECADLIGAVCAQLSERFGEEDVEKLVEALDTIAAALEPEDLSEGRDAKA